METWLGAIFQRLSARVESGQAPVKLGAGNRVLISQSVGSERIYYTLLGYGSLYCTALMALASHGSDP